MRRFRFACLFSTLFSTLAISQSVQGPYGAVNFQNVNVCPARQTFPKPCSRTSKVNFNVLAPTTFGTTEVVTQGVSNLDFTLNATTCTGTLAAGSSCYVRVDFAPRAPGVRMGAVQLKDSVGNLIASTYIYGNGQGPAAAFNPGIDKNLPVTGYDGGAMAVDAAGDVYFSAGGSIAEFDPRTGMQNTVANGVPYFATGLAVDGAGNIFVSGGGLVKVAAGTGVVSAVGAGLFAGSVALVVSAPLVYFTELRHAAWLTYSASALGSTAVIYLALFAPQAWLQSALRNRFLAFTGMVSYGLYLLHKIPYDLLKAAHYDKYPFLSFVFTLVAGYLLAYASWILLEKPFLKLKRHFGEDSRTIHASTPTPALASPAQLT